METCAKCGKDLSLRERKMVYWNHQLKDGYIKPPIGAFGLSQKNFPEYKGKKICAPCYNEIFLKPQPDTNVLNSPMFLGHAKDAAQTANEIPSTAVEKITLNSEVNTAILWQADETPIGQAACKEFFEARGTTFGAELGHNGFLVVTNQRLLFACKLGMMSKNYGLTYGINLEDIISASLGKFGFNNKLIILDKTNQRKEFINPSIQSLIPIINSAITERKRTLQAQKEKERVQIILDFSSLKDVMSKGGLVMTTYKCPSCGGMVKLPEAGKLLVCEYCGTPIKPVDIFEKIKSLIQ